MADLTTLAFEIPEAQKEGFRALVGLSDGETASLAAALDVAAPAMSAEALARRVGTSLDIDHDRLSSILTVLLSLVVSRDRYSLDTERVASDVAASAVKEGFVLSAEEAQVVASRLVRLLSIEKSLGISSKALDILLEEKNSFVGARVITDVRPVFSSELKPLAAMIVHNLEITSHTDGEHVSHFFALDVEDLRELQSVLERAIKKEESLRKTIGLAGISYIDAEM